MNIHSSQEELSLRGLFQHHPNKGVVKYYPEKGAAGQAKPLKYSCLVFQEIPCLQRITDASQEGNLPPTAAPGVWERRNEREQEKHSGSIGYNVLQAPKSHNLSLDSSVSIHICNFHQQNFEILAVSPFPHLVNKLIDKKIQIAPDASSTCSGCFWKGTSTCCTLIYRMFFINTMLQHDKYIYGWPTLNKFQKLHCYVNCAKENTNFYHFCFTKKNPKQIV